MSDTKKEIPVDYAKTLNVTSLGDLQSYAKGMVVRLPDFAEGQPFVARVKRPSLLALAKQGKIPNQLLSTAADLFSKGGSGLDTKAYGGENMLGDMYDICRPICEACLVAPTLEEIEEAGLTLSDDQIMAIFSYTQVGIKALEPFRTK